MGSAVHVDKNLDVLAAALGQFFKSFRRVLQRYDACDDFRGRELSLGKQLQRVREILFCKGVTAKNLQFLCDDMASKIFAFILGWQPIIQFSKTVILLNKLMFW